MLKPNMIAFEPELNIALAISSCSNNKHAISIIRKYLPLTVSEISASLKQQANFASFLLKRKNYYDGWATFYKLARELTDHDFNLQITINTEPTDFSFLAVLNDRITRIHKSEIY